MTLVEVELHSIDPSAVEATRATIQMLGAELVERDGAYFVQDGFIAFACEHQGYVRRVVRKPVGET